MKRKLQAFRRATDRKSVTISYRNYVWNCTKQLFRYIGASGTYNERPVQVIDLSVKLI